MAEIWDVLDDEARAKLVERPRPSWLEPTLAVLVDEPFSDPDWIYERKLDGVRTLVFRGDQVHLRSRNRKLQDAGFPEIVEALEGQPCRDFVADGEIVAFRGKLTSFERLQGRLGLRDARAARNSGIAVTLYLFDLPYLEGRDLRQLPLRQRKRLLKRALAFGGPVRYTPHRNEHGVRLLEQACAKGWEGLIAKDARAPYAGRRSRSWLKFKCQHGQELVIGGFTPPRGKRRHFGALLVGSYEDGELRYAGKVGTGFDERMLERLGARLASLRQDRSPFAEGDVERHARWVAPRLVGEFGFTEWTRDGKLRHPRFLGLRSDKDPRDVHRERPQKP